MKKVFLMASAVLMLSFLAVDPISKKERSYAAKLLKETEKGVKDQVKGLTEAQLKFKPAPDRWSIEECVKHIAKSEEALWQMTESAIKATANPDKRSEIKVTDEQLVQKVEDRSMKIKTMEKLMPENIPFKDTDEALESFKKNRDKLIDYVKSTEADLRNHVTALPFGMVDSYQMILFIAAHSNRHTQQIIEVKADPNFPK
ncbi:DinB family protein [Niastella caeni]|uniref:DinB family protein n=1 Tax=Niastella caeni TaxID=2569763 RepID=A0A4S8HUF0_9BACT|nr:DinB family protein [Niastella caeni]THU39180.1 DinB family protein [Niastella caeni]